MIMIRSNLIWHYILFLDLRYVKQLNLIFHSISRQISIIKYMIVFSNRSNWQICLSKIAQFVRRGDTQRPYRHGSRKISKLVYEGTNRRAERDHPARSRHLPPSILRQSQKLIKIEMIIEGLFLDSKITRKFFNHAASSDFYIPRPYKFCTKK